MRQGPEGRHVYSTQTINNLLKSQRGGMCLRGPEALAALPPLAIIPPACGLAADLDTAWNEDNTIQYLERDKRRIVLHSACRTHDRVPVQDEGETLGWVAGGMGRELLASFLTRLVTLEEEKRALANETISRYREINLLYRLSEKLAETLEVRSIALTVIEEARLLIKCSTGALLLHEAGFAKGKRVTTHWSFIETLRSPSLWVQATFAIGSEWQEVALLTPPLLPEEQ